MKLGTILTASDLNPLYCEFIPIFIKSWNILFPSADVIIVLVADEIPDYLKEYEKNIKLFKPVPNIHTAFQAQCIRLLYPRLVERNEGVLISDMDMIPMNRSYYVDAIQDISEDTFITYRDLYLPRDLPMCYNIAIPNTWKKMFGDDSTENLLTSWFSAIVYDGTHGGKGWGTDQQILLSHFNKWNGPKRILNDSITKYKRLDRHTSIFFDLGHLEKLVKSNQYCDYHCFRPYSKYKDINDLVVSWLQ